MKLMDLVNKGEGEEVQNSATSIPRTMILAVIINGMLALGWIIALLFSIGDVEAALESPTGYPVIEILYQATGSIGAATAMMCAIIIVAFLQSLASWHPRPVSRGLPRVIKDCHSLISLHI